MPTAPKVPGTPRQKWIGKDKQKFFMDCMCCRSRKSIELTLTDSGPAAKVAKGECKECRAEIQCTFMNRTMPELPKMRRFTNLTDSV